MQFKVMSFNIRYKNSRDEPNIWDNRKDLVINVIKQQDPDIIGFQEVLKIQLDFLKENLQGYDYYGVGRNNGKNRGEFAPIFYKKTIKLHDKGTFWLSSTPKKPSKGWGNLFKRVFQKYLLHRIVSWSRFSLGDGENVVIANTHFPLRKFARLNSIELIRKKIKQDFGNGLYPMILMGDFNFNPSSLEYIKMSEFLHDSFIQVPENQDKENLISFHQFSGEIYFEKCPSKEGRIDFLWVNDKLEVSNSVIEHEYSSKQDTPKNIFPSDHWPIWAIFETQDEKYNSNY